MNRMFLVLMLLRGNAYHMGSHAGAWEPGKIICGNLRNLPAMPALHIKADATVLFTKFIIR